MFRNLLLLLIAIPLWVAMIFIIMPGGKMGEMMGKHSEERHEKMMEMKGYKEDGEKEEKMEEIDTKVTIDDLDPALVEQLNTSFQALNEGITGSQMNAQEISFFTAKLLEKNYTQAEAEALQAEYKTLLDQAIENAKQQEAETEAQETQDNTQAQTQTPPNAQTPRAPVTPSTQGNTQTPSKAEGNGTEALTQ